MGGFAVFRFCFMHTFPKVFMTTVEKTTPAKLRHLVKRHSGKMGIEADRAIVYVFFSERLGGYKIGFSGSVNKSRTSLQHALGIHDLVEIHRISTNYPRFLEAVLHTIFGQKRMYVQSNKRVSREFFELRGHDIDWIKSIHHVDARELFKFFNGRR